MMTSNSSNKHIQVCCRIRSASSHACSVDTNDLCTEASIISKNINNSESKYDNVNMNCSSNYDDSINCVHKRVQSLSDLVVNDPDDADDEDAFNGHESGSTRYASTATAVYEVVTSNGIYQMDYVFDRDDTQVLCLIIDINIIAIITTIN